MLLIYNFFWLNSKFILKKTALKMVHKDNTENFSPICPSAGCLLVEAMLLLYIFTEISRCIFFLSFFFFWHNGVLCFIFSFNVHTLEMIPHVKNKQALLFFFGRSTWYSLPWQGPIWLTNPYFQAGLVLCSVNRAAVNNRLHMCEYFWRKTS